MEEYLKKEVKYIKGVGLKKAESLNKIGIYTVKDLIEYFPRAYDDRSIVKKLADILEGERVTVEASIVNSVYTRFLGKFKSVSKVVISDGTEQAICTWFNQPYVSNQLKIDAVYRFYGKFTRKNGGLELSSPVFDLSQCNKNTGKIIPVYPLTSDIKSSLLRNSIDEALKNIDMIPEILPDYIVKKYNLMNYDSAIRKIHFPEKIRDVEKAHRRLVFDEFLSMQLGILKLREENISTKKGIKYSSDVRISDFIDNLPFKLTAAQMRVIKEIDFDMENEKQMNRLLQGDVGSGKTVVSMCSAFKTVRNGYQAAILAPTMILAVQHFNNYQKMFDKFGIKCGLLVGGMTAKAKREMLEKIKNNDVDIVIGTHALLEEDVVFNKLGLVVTDEQHRFGVKQRSKIIAKGDNPDILVMTATPIPRTLALILYGDLDISIIDELPPNRKKIQTYAVGKNYDERVNNFIREQLLKGRQAYIVCPLVEEGKPEIKVDEKTGEQYIDLKAVNTVNLKSVEKCTDDYKKILDGYNVVCLHGKMKSKEKDDIMEKFKNGEIDVLVSTTVIEVGVDVPNASLMIIENSERFGLAQLHQLRGRVGRGEYESFCILKYESSNDIVRQRLELMVKSDDGFKIAEKDLELRGSGDVFGTKQHGLPEFKIANIYKDIECLKEVQVAVSEIFADDPNLSKEENLLLRNVVSKKIINKQDLVI
jgi:ATP-dependent DNA helicase recG